MNDSTLNAQQLVEKLVSEQLETICEYLYLEAGMPEKDAGMNAHILASSIKTNIFRQVLEHNKNNPQQETTGHGARKSNPDGELPLSLEEEILDADVVENAASDEDADKLFGDLTMDPESPTKLDSANGFGNIKDVMSVISDPNEVNRRLSEQDVSDMDTDYPDFDKEDWP
jgi:hypothetical protein